jgi:molecular chaperone HscA
LADIIETGDNDSVKALKAACDALNQATQAFAARRMDASVKTALAGQRLEDFASPA